MPPLAASMEDSSGSVALAPCRSLLSTVPDSIFAVHIGPLATSRELACFCLASRDAGQLEPLLARMVAEIQHGVFQDCRHGEGVPATLRAFTLVEVCHTLDCMRDRASFEFTRPFMAAVLKPERRIGGPRTDFMLVDVGGGRTGFRTVAACPPVRGDCWKLLLPLRRGRYQLIISGWQNPHHGILDITLNGKAVSPSEGLDWYSDTSTTPHTFAPMPFEVISTGTHILRGETSRCNLSALGAKYWMCLESLRVLPAHEVEAEETADVPAVRQSPGPRRRPAALVSSGFCLLATAAGAVAMLGIYGLQIVQRPLLRLLSSVRSFFRR